MGTWLVTHRTVFMSASRVLFTAAVWMHLPLRPSSPSQLYKGTVYACSLLYSILHAFYKWMPENGRKINTNLLVNADIFISTYFSAFSHIQVFFWNTALNPWL